MRAVGIIAEYNPFHRGHLEQIRTVRKTLNGKTVIVVALSSFFTQRGLPALLSPRQRAQIALACGADLVLLLPQSFACADGEQFARGGVNLLAATGIVDILCFGSEWTDQDLLKKCAALIAPESPELKAKIADKISEGFSPHQARNEALLACGADEAVIACLNTPNSRLGVEYLAAVRQLPPEWKRPRTLITPRSGHAENSLALDGAQASATALRQLFEDGGERTLFRLRALSPEMLEHLSRHLPSPALAVLLQAAAESGLPLSQALSPMTVHQLLSSDATRDLGTYRYMGGGLAERLTEFAQHWDPRQGWPDVAAWSSRNFSPGRIRRALLSLLLGINQAWLSEAGSLPAFLHPLGFTADGKYLLRKMKEKATLPVLARISDASEHASGALRAQIALERRAELLWNQLSGCAESTLLLPPLQMKAAKGF